jgi:C4-dicarboxylate transporter DctM subunit
MAIHVILFFAAFFAMLLIGLPIAITLAITGVLISVTQGIFKPVLLGHVMFQGVDSFSLLAVPFFMLAGGLMDEGGISRRLMNFAYLLVGRMRGGLAQVGVVLSMLFAGLSGSAVADTAALSSMLAPSMKEKGYREGFIGALFAAGGAIGPIIPPSIPMIIYGVAANASISKLFIGGIIPGIFLGLLLMVYVHFEAVRHNYPRATEKVNPKELIKASRDGLLALALPVIVLGGIRLGIFTATESSVMAVVYAFILGKFVYKELKWSKIPEILASSARGTSSVLIIIAAASFLSWVLTSRQIPQNITTFLLSVSKSPMVIILLLNLFMLFLGMFIDAVSIIVLITPVATPILMRLGVDPVYFGLLLVFNVCIGALTPPVGTCLFVASSAGKIPLNKIIKAVVPIVCIELVWLLLAILFPSVLMFLPNALSG